MADLIGERLDEHVFPFTNTGVDYLGPIEHPTKYLEKMLVPLHLSNDESRAHQSRTLIGHRVMSSCSDKIHYKTWQPSYRHQRQRNKSCWSSQRAESIHERVG